MTTFDGSTGGTPADATDTTGRYSSGADPRGAAQADDYPTPEELDNTPAVSSLDLLLKAVNERDAERDERTYRVIIPGLDVAMSCRIDFPYTDWEAWQKLAIPREKRKRPSATDMRQNVLFALVLNRTCEYLEYKTATGWAPITGDNGEPIPYGSEAMRREFNVMDEASLLRKLFGNKDGHVIRAGQRVVAAAGYSDEADEKEALAEASESDGDPVGE